MSGASTNCNASSYVGKLLSTEANGKDHVGTEPGKLALAK